MESLVRYAPLLAGGALVTVALALLSLALATLLGALGAAGRLGGGRVARGRVLVYTTLVRGIPDLVLILLVYFGGQRLVNRSPARSAPGRSTSRRSSPACSRSASSTAPI